MEFREVISLLERLIKTPSISRDESAVADIVWDEFLRLGFQPQRKGNNVWAEAWAYDAGKPTILLDAHLDTVKPVAGWVRDPFTPSVEGERLYGLGSNDTGASLVSLIATFVRLAQREQPYNLICLASAEEEVTGIGGVRMVLEELPKIDFAIVGEPTQMHPAVAERGLMVFDCVARGVSGHAARQEGVNAIYKAMEDIEWFRSYTFPRISPMLGPVKMSVTGIEAGTQHNVIPAECRFVVDVRVNECYQNEELLALVREQVHSEVTPRSTHLSSSFISFDHPAVKRLKALGRVPFASPTMSNQAVMPFTTLKLGPGDSARSHTADEYIQLSEIEQAMEIYYDLLNGLKIKS
ncbi:MAG: M20 family metallo-hydrolase [Alistipes sp.]|nr:M20 family metallo-hydrolase [Alistipes sp.]